MRKVTSFRRVGMLYRRDQEVHRLAIVDPAATLATLREIGFRAEIIPAYDGAALPTGLIAFLCREP